MIISPKFRYHYVFAKLHILLHFQSCKKSLNVFGRNCSPEATKLQDRKCGVMAQPRRHNLQDKCETDKMEQWHSQDAIICKTKKCG